MLAVGLRPPSVYCHMGLSNIAICFIKARERERERERELANKTDITILSSLMVDVTSHYLSHILLGRSKPLSHPTFKEKELHKDVTIRR